MEILHLNGLIEAIWYPLPRPLQVQAPRESLFIRPSALHSDPEKGTVTTISLERKLRHREITPCVHVL